MNQKRRQEGKGAIEIIEEAVHLLRLSPASLLASYYIGGLPFVLGLLYFWSDMSRNAFADKYCAAASFGLAMLFAWMKCWQAVFARQVRAQISREPAPAWTLGRIGHLAATQTIVQASGLFILPLALLMTVPFSWLYAFYQNASAEWDVESHDVKTLCKKSWQQAKLWPGQNHVLILILSLFGVFVFINVATGLFLLPYVLKSLLGVESLFTKSGWAMLNTTFLAATFGISYLCLDPVVKAVYVLRCFYGSSLQSGEDLKVELKKFVPSKGTVAAALMLLMASIPTHSAMASEDSDTLFCEYQIVSTSISPAEIDRSIREVISRREYTWRMPRERPEGDDRDRSGLLTTFMAWTVEVFKTCVKTIARWIGMVLDWLDKLLPRTDNDIDEEPSGMGWMISVRGFLFLLLALLICILAVFSWRMWQRRKNRKVTVISQAVPSTPDLTDDQTGADELPVNRWLMLARELMDEGALRLAMRAFYLGTLAHLAEHEMITIAKHKSNRDYERELSRHAHEQQDLMDVFSNNVLMFDRVWYGKYELTPEDVSLFAANQERIAAIVKE